MGWDGGRHCISLRWCSILWQSALFCQPWMVKDILSVFSMFSRNSWWFRLVIPLTAPKPHNVAVGHTNGGVFARRATFVLTIPAYQRQPLPCKYMRSILRIPQVSTPYATNGTDGHVVREMCHKEQKMGTMVEKFQPISPVNFLYNMVKIFVDTGNALTPSCLQTPFAARNESTSFCGWVSSTGKRPLHIRKCKGATPYPQPEFLCLYFFAFCCVLVPHLLKTTCTSTAVGFLRCRMAFGLQFGA